MSALKKRKADAADNDGGDARALEALALQLLGGAADRTEVHSKALATLLTLTGSPRDGLAVAHEKRLRETEAAAERLADTLNEQRELQEVLEALSAAAPAAPAGAAAGSGAGDILERLLESRALNGKIAELKQVKAATQQAVSDLHGVLQQWNASVPAFAAESAQLSRAVKMVPLGPETEDAILAEMLPSALFVLYRMLAVQRVTYGTDGVLNVAVVQRTGLPAGVQPMTVELTVPRGTLSFAYSATWGFVLACAQDESLLAQFATSAADDGRRFPSQDTEYRLLMLRHSDADAAPLSEAGVLGALAPWRPYHWCQQLCGVRCFLASNAGASQPRLTVDAFVRRLLEPQ